MVAEKVKAEDDCDSGKKTHAVGRETCVKDLGTFNRFNERLMRGAWELRARGWTLRWLDRVSDRWRHP